jgi:hypothetical protein
MESGSSPAHHIPTDTVQAARKVYNIQNIYLRIGDEIEAVRAGFDPALLDPSESLGRETAFRLAMTTAFQYAEVLPDPLASEATRKRLDWKYALYLPITFPGIAPVALCAFRQNLTPSTPGMTAFRALLENLRKFSLFTRLSNHALDADSAISTVCVVTRLYRLSQAMKSALGLLVAEAPDWLRANALPHWYERYRNTKSLQPNSANALEEARAIGADIQYLTLALRRDDPAGLAALPELQELSSLLDEQFQTGGGGLSLRPAICAGCACRHYDAL